VLEVLKISADGMQINIYQPNMGRGSPMKERPPTPPAESCKQYSYHQLPQKYYKKYHYAARCVALYKNHFIICSMFLCRFVNLVRSKTPKITLYTKKAKCMLMENQPKADFEVIFYDGMCDAYH
jgi:polo-like kinase 4